MFRFAERCLQLLVAVPGSPAGAGPVPPVHRPPLVPGLDPAGAPPSRPLPRPRHPRQRRTGRSQASHGQDRSTLQADYRQTENRLTTLQADYRQTENR